jgi:AcrR family transcriptional regulator
MKTFQGQEDLRVRRTHKLLWEALMIELSEGAFDEITVKDICERAMVHRTTFYKHYEDKYALLEQGMRQMYDALLAEVKMPSSAFSVDDPLPSVTRFFIHVVERQQFYKLMLCGEGFGRFQKLIKEYIAKLDENKMSALAPANPSLAVPPAVHAQFLSGAFISILVWWLENDMPLSPAQMARYFLSLRSSVLSLLSSEHSIS